MKKDVVMRGRWLLFVEVAVIAAMGSGIAGASSFTVVLKLLPAPDGYTVQSHTRIGATCGLQATIGGKTTPTLPSKHVPSTGIVSWKLVIKSPSTTAITATVACTWKGQIQIATVNYQAPE